MRSLWVSWLALLAVTGCLAQVAEKRAADLAGASTPKPVELLRDSRFKLGVVALDPQPGDRRELGVLPGPEAAGRPAWWLAQWSSQYPLKPAAGASSELLWTNVARHLMFFPREATGGDLELGVDSRPEYGGAARTNSHQPWPHLLVEQEVTRCPPLTMIGQVRFSLEARLVEAERIEAPGYSPALHAAQFQFVLTLGNRNRDSKGFGDFLWFVVPMYDDRHPTPPVYVAADFADPSAKLIYNPGAAVFSRESMHGRGWVRFQADLRPHLLDALRTAWSKGYLPGSQDPADYRVTSVNLGWEVPGLNRVAIRVRRLQLEVVPIPSR